MYLDNRQQILLCKHYRCVVKSRANVGETSRKNRGLHNSRAITARAALASKSTRLQNITAISNNLHKEDKVSKKCITIGCLGSRCACLHAISFRTFQLSRTPGCKSNHQFICSHFAFLPVLTSAGLPAASTYCRQTAAVWQLQHHLQSTFLKARLMISSSDCKIHVFQITSQAQVGIWALSLHTSRYGACLQCACCNTLAVGCMLMSSRALLFSHQVCAMSSLTILAVCCLISSTGKTTCT